MCPSPSYLLHIKHLTDKFYIAITEGYIAITEGFKAIIEGYKAAHDDEEFSVICAKTDTQIPITRVGSLFRLQNRLVTGVLQGVSPYPSLSVPCTILYANVR